MRRSMLFIPGNSPGMLLSADIHQADAVIFDLEDAVSPLEKDAARILVRNAIRAFDYRSVEIIVRINPLDSGFVGDDIAAMVPLRPSLLMPAKVSGAGDIGAVSRLMAQAEADAGLPENAVGIIALLETALAIERGEIVWLAPRPALLLGAEDHQRPAALRKEGAEIAYARRVVMAGAQLAWTRRHALH